ncbi:MAG TPA: hypothetical protein VFL47_10015 [Flavisolibacter sp.]|nr:hypothetical protein [Flavisolibacter sp.]
MKTILIAATAVGAVVAGLILYLQGSVESKNKIANAANDAYRGMNNGLGQLERPAQHAMG